METNDQHIKNDTGVAVKRILLFCAFLPFVLLYWQQIHPIKNFKSLKGDYVPAENTEFGFQNWFSGDYQSKKDKWLNENFGFRTIFVRINNQVKFSLFRKAQAGEVIVGKENFLYVQGYVNGYYGLDFIGDNSINDTIAEIKLLQDTLRSLGKTLTVVLAPSKVRVYPEYLPDNIIREVPIYSNYSSYVKGFKNSGVNYIDFNEIFLQKKNASSYLLFPQLGVHWSKLEAVRAADTISKFIASLSGRALPRINISKIEAKDELFDPDNDAIEGMNLMKYPSYRKMAYPQFEYVDQDKKTTNALVISDSYWWDIYLQQIPRNIFKYNDFWYYCRDVWGNNHLGKKDISAVDVKRKILQADHVIIICAESNLERLGFGFPGAALSAMRKTITPTTDELNQIKKKIHTEKDWLAQVEAKAAERKISLDSMISLDANWSFQYKGPVIMPISLNDIKDFILATDDWMKDVKRKALEQNISVDSMVTKDALWYKQTVLEQPFDENSDGLTKIERIKKLIREDNAWMEQIKEKAKERKISIDSMIVLDALWTIEQEKNKSK